VDSVERAASGAAAADSLQSVQEGRHSGVDAADRHGRVMLLIDAANVVGSRPDGWWRDRAGASLSLVDRVRAAVEAGRLAAPVVVVLEGDARRGAEEGESGGVTVVHASGSGDDSLVALASEAGGAVMLVSADRGLRRRAEALGADVAGPGRLLALLDG
jgi:hypothetical protein